jgi:hypothetical protein
MTIIDYLSDEKIEELIKTAKPLTRADLRTELIDVFDMVANGEENTEEETEEETDEEEEEAENGDA